MMNLIVQIFSFIFSFFYGVFVYLIIYFNFRTIFRYKTLCRKFLIFIEMLIISLIYFLIIYLINDGILHTYFLLLIIFGILLVHNFIKKCKFM